MKLAVPDYDSVLYVAQNMREWDRREIFATRWDDDPAAFAQQVMSLSEFGWVAGLEKPIASIGAFPVWPGVWSVWMFATDDFRQIGKSLTKFTKQAIIPALLSGNIHRAQCHSLVGHDGAHRWLEALGATCEATIRGYGKGGEDFLLYAWDRAGAQRAQWNGAARDVLR